MSGRLAAAEEKLLWIIAREDQARRTARIFGDATGDDPAPFRSGHSSP